MTDRWHIDELARESGLTVDTIRYYQRECLLPPGEREGRHRVYGPEHLQRLSRIKEFQARRFSIAAIRALVSGEEGRLDGVFADEGEGSLYTYDELVERSAVGPDLAAALREAAVLRDPVEFGRVAYDGDDLEMLRAMGQLARLGMPAEAVCALSHIYAEGIEATQRRIVEVFASGGDLEWEPGELARFQHITAAESSTILVSMRRLVDYLHHRTIQRLTLDAVERGALPAPGAD